ncbi:hypothetical protein ACVFI8_06985 [Agarivorans sp. MS3-6]
MFEAIQKETFLSQKPTVKSSVKVLSSSPRDYPPAKQIIVTNETQAWLVDDFECSAFNDSYRPRA